MQKRKKILYVITKSNWGGAQKYVFDLATHLSREQFEIAVVCGSSTGSGQAGELIEKLREAGIRTIPIPVLERDINVWREIISFFSLLKIFIREKPDIIHLNSSKVGGLGAIAAFLHKLLTFNFKLLTIFTVHGWPFKEDRPKYQKLIIFFSCWLSSLFQNKIILIDQAELASSRWFIPNDKLYLIPHGIAPIDFLEPALARSRLAEVIGYPLSPHTVIIGTIAELTPNKGLNYLLEALYHLKAHQLAVNFQTIIIGDGQEREKLQQQIHSSNLREIVAITGFLADASRYLSAFDVFILPSLKEGLPYVLAEAMAAGLPIVATKVGGIPDLIEHGKSGLLVPAKDPVALAKAIVELIQYPEGRQSLGREAQRKVKTQFGIKAMIDKTAAVYHQPDR